MDGTTRSINYAGKSCAESDAFGRNPSTEGHDLNAALLRVQENLAKFRVNINSRSESCAIAALNEEECNSAVSLLGNLDQVTHSFPCSGVRSFGELCNAVLCPRHMVYVHEEVVFGSQHENVDSFSTSVLGIDRKVAEADKCGKKILLETFSDNLPWNGDIDAHPRAVHVDHLPGVGVASVRILALRKQDRLARLTTAYHRTGIGTVCSHESTIVELDIYQKTAISPDELSPNKLRRELHTVRVEGVKSLSRNFERKDDGKLGKACYLVSHATFRRKGHSMNAPRVGFVYSETFLQHRTPEGHPERPARLQRLLEHLKTTDLWQKLTHLQPRVANEQDILAVHSREHYVFIKEICGRGGGMLDEGDTHAVRESFEAALLAAGAVITAIDAVLQQKAGAAFCAVRPPGHHAERDRAMGFCLFNNVAVGARYAQRVHGIGRVAILDWDVHHGNGTQHIFEADPTVLYISLHQYPFYPGTGAREERGVGEGVGFTLNIPLPAGSGEQLYLEAFDREVVPALRKYCPDVLIISAGFDAHRDDPLANMLLTEQTYRAMTERILGIAPMVSVLEGGYNLDALARCVEAHMRAIVGK